jgi:hypothetical protein
MPTRALEIMAVVTEDDADGDASAPGETTGVVTPSRIAEYVSEVPNRLTGSNGNGAKLPTPELVN